MPTDPSNLVPVISVRERLGVYSDLAVFRTRINKVPIAIRVEVDPPETRIEVLGLFGPSRPAVVGPGGASR